MERRLLTLLAETPVHAGGPESLAAVDLPIQREAATGLPVIWGQSLKGALRQAWRDAQLPGQEAVFGSRPPRREQAADEDETAGEADGEAGGEAVAGGSLTKGAVSVGDAQLVAFPASTLRQVFAWVSAPLLLSRLGRKLRLIGTDPGTAFPAGLTGDYGLGTPAWAGSQVIGPFSVNIRSDPRAATVGGVLARLACPDLPAFGFTRQKMSEDVLLVEDSTLSGLAKMGTDVVARVQLDEEEKKVKHGPFYSEHLPAETVLAAVLAGSAEHLDRLATLLNDKPLQLGGDETLGKGVLWCRMHSASSSATALTGESGSERSAPPDSVPPPTPVPPSAPARPPDPAPAQGKPTPAVLGQKKHG